MPWLIPSHQAPVLPLKLWKPAWFSGLALALGTAAPDLVFILRLDETGSPTSHTFLGQVLITMPLVVVLHLLATTLVFPWLLPRLPGGAPLHLHALARCRPAGDALGLAKVALSGLIGGLSHVTIDGFTHGDESGWALPLFPVLGTPLALPFGPLPLYDVLQGVLTVGLGALALRAWGRMAPQLLQDTGAAARRRVRPVPLPTRRVVAAGLFAAALLGALLAPLAKGALAGPDGVKLAAYGAISACCAAAVAGALLDRAQGVLDRIRLDVRSALETDGIRGSRAVAV
jgi:hypothetical protein